MSLAIILVTRNRPHLLIPTIEETMRNATRSDTRLIVAIDDDDAATQEAVHKADLDDRVIISVMPREDTVGEKYNNRLELVKAGVYAGLVDYTPHQTHGFDQKILEAAKVFPDGIGCVFSDMINLSFTGMHSATARWIELVGSLYPEHFPYWFIDHWLDDLAKMTGRYTHVNIAMDHHSRRPGTMERREPWLWASLYDTLYLVRHRQANRILQMSSTPRWQADILRAQWPLINQRSQILNNIVRKMPDGDLPHDARYLRMREKAVARLQAWAAEQKEAA